MSALIDRPGRLIAHTAAGVLEIPLLGEARADALLERWAARGGAIVDEQGALVVPDVEPPAGAKTADVCNAQGELLAPAELLRKGTA